MSVSPPSGPPLPPLPPRREAAELPGFGGGLIKVGKRNARREVCDLRRWNNPDCECRDCDARRARAAKEREAPKDPDEEQEQQEQPREAPEAASVVAQIFDALQQRKAPPIGAPTAMFFVPGKARFFARNDSSSSSIDGGDDVLSSRDRFRSL
tara:strand:- start:1975 stop:2433 length:459 start_codon:yes stop_codon:yes gene_type:complete